MIPQLNTGSIDLNDFFVDLQKKKNDAQPTATTSSTDMFWDIALGANKVVGVIVMMICAYKWSAYLATLHENHFWFSEIKVWFFESFILKRIQSYGHLFFAGSRAGNLLPNGERPGTDSAIDFIG